MASRAWRRLGLWRVTRGPLAKALYDRLTSAGVRMGRLDRYVRDAGVSAPELLEESPIDNVVIHRANTERPAALAGDPVAPDDRILTARLDGRQVGYCVLSDRPVYVSALDRRLAFRGAYIWRVYVDRDERGRGVGTMLIASAVAAAGTQFETDTVTALVAPDNVPSRRAFRKLGFSRRERYTTIGFGRWTWTRESPTT